MSKEKITPLGGVNKTQSNNPPRPGPGDNKPFSLANISFFTARNFKIVSVAVLLIMVFMSLDYGINGDEKFQVDYSKKLWSYYSTFGKDTSALNVSEGQIHLYGGLFDMVAISLDKMVGLNNEWTPGFHYIRRVLCAMFGFTAIFFISLFARQIGGWPLAFITLIFMVLSPRFMGDAMVNPKDIPFAAGFSMGLYFISRYIRELPKPTVRTMLGVIAGTMIALNSRAGGLLLIVYLFLFVAIFLIRKLISTEKSGYTEVWTCLKYTLFTGLLSYLAGIIFWPYALSNPLTHPLKALAEFTNQPLTLPVLFKGQHVLNTKLPLNYLPEWIIRTIPVFAILGIFFFLRLFIHRYKELPFMEISIMVFAFLFPLGYAMYKHSSLHDGWRHFTFVYPSIVILAAVGWSLWITASRSASSRRLYLILLVILLSENVYAIFKLHPYQYAYFNPLFGGLHKAYGNFETDYWMLSIKEASAWLKKHEKIGVNGRPSVIATNCMYPATIYLNDTSKGIKTDYVRYYERSQSSWDYALFYSRFVDRSQLLNHTWPPKGTIHTIDADGIPLCAIVKRENKEDYLGFEAVSKNDISGAIQHFHNALEYDPNNESVGVALAIIYFKIGQMDQAELALRQSLQAYPGNPAAASIINALRAEREKVH